MNTLSRGNHHPMLLLLFSHRLSTEKGSSLTTASISLED